MNAFEIRMVASPTRGSYGQIAFFVASLRELGYSASEVFVRVFVGASSEAEIDPLWRRPFGDVDVIWANPKDVERVGMYAQIDQAFLSTDFRSPILLYCDTDTVWLARIDEILTSFATGPDKIAGVMAHYPPPWKHHQKEDPAAWQALGQGLLGTALPLDCAYSIRTDLAAPFYPNYGFVVMHASIMESHAQDYVTLANETADFLEVEYFKYQVAIPLLCEKYGIVTESLKPIYNFVNDPLYESMYPTMIGEARVVHYLRLDRLNRSEIFSDRASYQAFSSASFSGIEHRLQERALKLWGASESVPW